MIRFAYTVCAALLLMLCMSLIPVLSQDMGGEKKDEKSMEEEWMKLQQPGPMQKWLAEEVGDWDVSGKMWMAGAKDPMDFKATSKITMKFERYLHEDFSMEGMQGYGLFSYDNSNEEFQALWTSNHGTSMHVLSGKLDEKTGRLEMSGSWTEKGMGGMTVKSRVVSTRKSKDSAMVEVYDTYGDAPEMKIIEMTYTRKK